MRKAAVIISLTAIFLTIGWVFWYQDGKYLLPTPIPPDYTTVLPGETISIDSSNIISPALLHFFNPDCPCSRFNLKHFQVLTEKYRSIKFYAVVTDQEKAASARNMLGSDITVIIDDDEKLAKKCGVYSTPQAAILTEDQTLFFRGNYNRARYCTDKNSNFVQMALDSLAANRTPPIKHEINLQGRDKELIDCLHFSSHELDEVLQEVRVNLEGDHPPHHNT